MLAKFLQSEIQKKYDVDLRAPMATGGHGLLWRVFSAVKKKEKGDSSKTKVSCSIHVFNKEDKHLKAAKKNDLDTLLSILRADIAVLQRYAHAPSYCASITCVCV
jgi:hypothetical protein